MKPAFLINGALTLLLAGSPVVALAEGMTQFTCLHEAPAAVEPGQAVELVAKVAPVASIAYVALHYRAWEPKATAESEKFRLVYFDPQDPVAGIFATSLPSEKFGESGLEYYISVVDLDGELHVLFASAGLPQRVVVSMPQAGEETAEAQSPAPVAAPGAFSRMREEFELFEAESAAPGTVSVTATRRAQKIEESPSAISILTAEQIRQSGASTVAEALRLVPGVSVMMVNATSPNVSIRGFNGQNPNKILTLVDGRSVYTDVFGLTFWEVMPIALQDVERIEVIRGPVSALYGANAFNGVINIITKSPKQSKTFEFDHRLGTRNLTSTTVSSGHDWDGFGFRLTAQQYNHDDWDTLVEKTPAGETHEYNDWDKSAEDFFDDRFSSEFDEDRPTDQRSLRVNGKLVWNAGEQSRFSLGAGAADGNLVVSSGIGDIVVQGLQTHVEADVDVSDFHFQAYWNRIDLDADIVLYLVDPEAPDFRELFAAAGPLAIKDGAGDTYDLEATYSLGFSKDYNLLLGGNYRSVGLKADRLDDPTIQQDWISGFAQLEARPADPIQFNLAGRVDNHPIAGTNFSPRLAAVYTPVEGHHFRASAGRAIRNPSILESSLDITVARLGEQAIRQEGNEDLEAEKVTSFELGYGTEPADGLRLTVDGYYNRIDDYVLATGVKSLDQIITGALSGQSTGAGLGFTSNKVDYSGVEVAADWDATDWLNFYANWSYVDAELLKEREACDPDLAAADGGTCPAPGEGPYTPAWDPVLEKGSKIKDFPNHMANVKVTLKGGGFTLSGWYYGQSSTATRTNNIIYGQYSTLREAQVAEPGRTRLAHQRASNPGFATFSLMASYQPIEETLELGVVAQNLFNNVHPEYPRTTVLRAVTLLPTDNPPLRSALLQGGASLDRLIYGYLTVKW